MNLLKCNVEPFEGTPPPAWKACQDQNLKILNVGSELHHPHRQWSADVVSLKSRFVLYFPGWLTTDLHVTSVLHVSEEWEMVLDLWKILMLCFCYLWWGGAITDWNLMETRGDFYFRTTSLHLEVSLSFNIRESENTFRLSGWNQRLLDYALRRNHA